MVTAVHVEVVTKINKFNSSVFNTSASKKDSTAITLAIAFTSSLSLRITLIVLLILVSNTVSFRAFFNPVLYHFYNLFSL